MDAESILTLISLILTVISILLGFMYWSANRRDQQQQRLQQSQSESINKALNAIQGNLDEMSKRLDSNQQRNEQDIKGLQKTLNEFQREVERDFYRKDESVQWLNKLERKVDNLRIDTNKELKEILLLLEKQNGTK